MKTRISLLLIIAVFLGVVIIGGIQIFASVTEVGIQAAIDKEFGLLQDNNLMEDDKKIEKLVDLYFMAINEDKKTANDINLSAFYYNDDKYSEHQKYLENKLKFKKKLSQTLDHKILWDSQNIQIRDLTVNGDTATVKAYLFYKYILDGYNRGFSSSGTEYDIVFKKYDNKWLIAEVKSNDEFDQEFFNTDFDVEKLVQERSIK